jgi:response regulator RpfG family c-di-GMP phosphodiesterase/tRNA A-37 threonylcarbamoyl transferase component Bud32
MATLPARIGKYDIRAQLGAGAMAVVYQAYDPVIERTLAIKVVDKARLDESESDTILQRFRVEARAAGRLQHQNIVAVYDFGEEGNLVYLVMECVFGRPLTAYLQSEDFRGEPDKVCDILLQILSALQYSHAQGVVHRDIKPANIMVTREGSIKIADFGVARIESSQLTQTGDLIGTPSYMSPEQFAGETADARTDLYATSVVFYELLTRKRPFEGSNNAVIMHRVFTEMPTAPSIVNPLLSDALDAVVLRGMAKDAQDRYQSAHDFALAIRDAMSIGLLKTAAPAVDNRPKIAPNLLKAVRTAPAAPAGNGEAARTAPGTVNQRATLAPLKPTPAAAAEKPVVLFVDDEARILTALHALFRQKYTVFTSDDPRQAVEMVKRLQVHVLVSDQRMPNMLGVELLREVKEISPKTVRILLTGYSDLASIVGSINEGEVWRFINKPWDTQDVQRIVAEAVAIATEMPEIPAWQMPAKPRFEESILALDPGNIVTPDLLRRYGERHWVAQARDLDEAITLLQEREVAVLVADMDSDPQEVKSLLHLLKRDYPQILTIAVTQTVDAEMLIELINEAQVHRFISKPVNAAQLQQHVDAALNRYHTYKATPALAMAQKVEEQKAAPVLKSGLMDRLRAIARLGGR